MEKYTISVLQVIQINKDLPTAFSRVSDVKNWDKLSANFEKMELVLQQDNLLLTRMTSHHNSMKFDRYTLRELSKNEWMKFEHITLGFPIAKHYGTWTFTKGEGNETTLSLQHNFKLKFGLIGYCFGKLVVGPFFFKKPTRKMLQQMKQSIENN